MNVLITHEKSGAVSAEFRKLGCRTWSCDLEPPDDDSQFHYVGDAIGAILHGCPNEDFWTIDGSYCTTWDFIGCHPPCDHLAVSGAAHFAAKRADGRQQAAIRHFLRCVELVEMAGLGYVESSVGIMSTLYRKPDQIIQPYQFGDDASKKTCLWLFGLPKLTLDPARYVQPRMVDGRPRWANQCDSGQNRLGPSPTRAADRARTYPGIAQAMAEQWGALAYAGI